MVQLIEALRYNPEGREFDSLWYHWKCLSHHRSGRAMAVGLTEPLKDQEYFLGLKAAGV